MSTTFTEERFCHLCYRDPEGCRYVRTPPHSPCLAPFRRSLLDFVDRTGGVPPLLTREIEHRESQGPKTAMGGGLFALVQED